MKRFLNNAKKFIALVLTILMVLPATSIASSAEFSIDDSLLYNGRVLTKLRTYSVTKGVTEGDIVLNNTDGTNQVKCYVLDIDMNNPDISIVAGYANADASSWSMSTVRSHASAAEEKYATNVVGGMNADYYNTRTGEPVGLFIMDGKVYKNNSTKPFFAILNDGTAVIRNAGGKQDDVKEAVGGARILIKNGVPVTDGQLSGAEDYPRAAVGIKADGDVVFFVADGRQTPDSCGMQKDDELAATLYALGCVDALMLDGGGSAILVGERECVSPLEVRSTPSYAGIERSVANSLLVCTAAEPTGVFDHVSFSEAKYEVFPYNSITVSAVGCDEYGYEAELPEGEFVVADTKYGTFNGNTFKATGELGETTINYVSNGEIIGSVNIIVSQDAPSTIQKIVEYILQAIANVFNLLATFIDKVGEKTGLY